MEDGWSESEWKAIGPSKAKFVVFVLNRPALYILWLVSAPRVFSCSLVVLFLQFGLWCARLLSLLLSFVVFA